MCKRETFKQLAGEQCKVICGAWASKHTYITVIYFNQSFVGLWTHNGVWKCLVHAEESVLLQVACAGPLTWIISPFVLYYHKLYITHVQLVSNELGLNIGCRQNLNLEELNLSLISSLLQIQIEPIEISQHVLNSQVLFQLKVKCGHMKKLGEEERE